MDKKSVNCQIDECREPTFSEFLNFLNKEHRFLDQYNRSMAGITGQPGAKSGNGNAKVAATAATTPAQKTQNVTPKTTGCAACGGNHQMHACETFDGLELAAKRKTIMAAGACFRCLEGGHMARHCKAEVKCAKCQRLHHTKAHELQVETATDVKTTA